MPFMTRVPADLVAAGLTVELVPGYETRGSSAFNPGGVTCHWTAGPKASKGRPSLNICVNGRTGIPGPLCNIYLARDGTCVVVALGRANHAGEGGFRGLVGNSAVYGIEAECGGDGDWTPAQRKVYPILVAALLRGIGRDASWAHGHHEWAPSRKIDIRDIMPEVRATAAGILGDPNYVPTPQENIMDARQEQAVIARLDIATSILGPLQNAINDPRMGVLAQLARISAALGTKSEAVDEKALAETISASLAPILVAALGEVADLTQEEITEATEKAVRGVFADAAA